jgi:hypothetical protein
MIESQAMAAKVQPPFKLPPPPLEILPVTQVMAHEYMAWFVNRRAFARQSDKPGANGKHYYYRPKIREHENWAYNKARQVSGKKHPDHDLIMQFYEERIHDLALPSEFAALDLNETCKHLSGLQTINLFAINPVTQCCKWLAIDADYKDGYTDLQKLKYELKENDIPVEAVVEESRRGGHLWIFCAEPVPAKAGRILIYHIAMRLAVPIKGYQNQPDGIEIFPRQDSLDEGQLGNALRAPLGIHRASQKRYWFEGAAHTLETQFDLLRKVKRLTNEELRLATLGLEMPEDFVSTPSIAQQILKPSNWYAGHGFDIMKYWTPRRKDRRNYWGQCPSCALHGGDRGRDNFAVKIDDTRKYKCWAGCTKEMIRAAVGAPPPKPGEYN